MNQLNKTIKSYQFYSHIPWTTQYFVASSYGTPVDTVNLSEII